MPFKVEFSFNTLQELQDFVNDSEKKDPSYVLSEEPAETKKTVKPIAKGPKPEPVEKTPAFIGKKPKAEEPESELTYNYVSKATTDAVAACGGSEEVKKVLKEFGVSTAKELSEEQWAPYLKKCGELIKAAKEDELA